MTWHLVTGEYPPDCGGVGDYTALLARALRRAGEEVQVWVPGDANATGNTSESVRGLPDRFGSRSRETLARAWQQQPGVVLLQYVPNALGVKGANLSFCRWLRGMLADALKAIATPWRALFVGAGPLEADLKSFASEHPDQVRVVTGVAHGEMPRWLNAMSMLCAPSQTTAKWREQFGRMSIEAMACGVPVIASESGEIPHVVGDAGLLVGERDRAAWTQTIRRVLRDATVRCDLGRRGRARVEQRFAWPVVARQHLEFFESLVTAET